MSSTLKSGINRLRNKMKRLKFKPVLSILLFILFLITSSILIFNVLKDKPKLARISLHWNYNVNSNACRDFELCTENDHIDFEHISNMRADLNETGFKNIIVPDIVHFIQFDNPYMTFMFYLAIK